MMKLDSKAFRKHAILASAGMTLQIIGSAILVAATLMAAKEVNTQVKKLLIQKLSEEA